MTCLDCGHEVHSHEDTADAFCLISGCMCEGLHLDVGDCTEECYV